MSSAWWKIPDIIPLAERSEGWVVRINDGDGLIYEQRGAWTLMVNILPDSTLKEELWAAVATLLLAAHGELGCGLCHFQEKWWITRRYRSYQEDNVEESALAQITHSVVQQLSLAGFVGAWPSFMRKDSPASHSLVLAVLK